jgi:hypothetical protein
MADESGDLISQEAARLEALLEEELWTCIRIWITPPNSLRNNQDIGVAFMGIFSDPEAAKARAVASNGGPIQWEHHQKACRYQGAPRPVRNNETIFFVVQKDKRR